MNNIDFHKKGEEFEYNGSRYRVIDTCKLCSFHNKCYTSVDKYCSSINREDGIDVIYEKVKSKNETVYQCLRYILSIIYSLCFTFFLTFGILLSFSEIKDFVAFAIASVITYMTNSVSMDFEN